MEKFLVGGAVRDSIMGIKSKDWDFSVVAPSFEEMRAELIAEGFQIFVETPEFFTIRARGPKGFAFGGIDFGTETFDFVWARKDGPYSDGRRPDFVVPGTLMDDLARRDFSCNAIAKDADGNLIDPFGGQEDIANQTIRAVGDAYNRIVVEDALRGLRAVRFSVTKGFTIEGDVQKVLQSDGFRLSLRAISTERIQMELDKAFKVDTPKAIEMLTHFRLVDTIFGRDRLHLVTSMKGK